MPAVLTAFSGVETFLRSSDFVFPLTVPVEHVRARDARSVSTSDKRGSVSSELQFKEKQATIATTVPRNA